MSTGDIILLNGTSSSGKSTIARLLQQRLEGLYLHVSFDHVVSMLPERFTLTGKESWDRVEEEWGNVLPTLLPGFYGAVAALAKAGNNLIVDHVLLGEYNARQCAAALAEHSVFSVGIDCPMEELKRREAQRGDRPQGLVLYQFEHIHVPGAYDLRVDTSLHSPEECASVILRVLAARADREAFSRLRS